MTTSNTSPYSRPTARFTETGMTIRASGATNCRRRLWYSATGATVTNPPDIDSQTIMSTGNALEPIVVAAMQARDWRITPWDEKTQGSVSLEITPSITVAGHPDAVGRPPFGFPFPLQLDPNAEKTTLETLKAMSYEQIEEKIASVVAESIIEIKTRGAGAHKRWRDLGAERSHPAAAVQAAIYTLGYFGELRSAIISTMSTDSRKWDPEKDFEMIPSDRIGRLIGRLHDYLMPLDEHFREYGADPEALPERDFEAGSLECRGCPFLATCGNIAPPDEPLEVTGDLIMEDAEQAVRELDEVTPPMRELKKRSDGARKTLRAFMEQQNAERMEIDGLEGPRRVTLSEMARRGVNYQNLNHYIDPETREKIVTETTSKQLRVK